MLIFNTRLYVDVIIWTFYSQYYNYISTVLPSEGKTTLKSTKNINRDSIDISQFSEIQQKKKVLLRERKRHTARRPAIAISCYSGEGGGPLAKNFFSPVWTCIKPNLVSKIFPFTETGYPPQKSETWDPPPKNLRPGTPPKIWDWAHPPVQGWIGYPPPPEMWTDCNYYLPPSFGWRAVIKSAKLSKINYVLCTVFKITKNLWEWDCETRKFNMWSHF